MRPVYHMMEGDPWMSEEYEEYPTYQKDDFTSGPETSGKWNLSALSLSL